MLDLQDLCSLPISFNTQKGTLTLGDDVILDDSEWIPLKSLTPSLLNKSLIYPTQVYTQYYNLKHADHQDVDYIDLDVHFDLLYLPEGLLGIEYIKSHIYYSSCNIGEKQISTIIEVIFGELTVLLQKNIECDEPKFYTEVEEGLIMKVKQGQKAAIPTGYYYTFINTSNNSVIFTRIYKTNSTADYMKLSKEKGLAYFCIRKNARCEIVKNPRYRNIPEVNEIDSSETLSGIDISPNLHLYDHIVKDIKQFSEILW